jgi:hypothetical protein
VKVLDLIREERKLYADVAKIYGKNESSIPEIVKKENEIHASLAVTPQTAKVTAKLCDECLVKMKKALNYRVQYSLGFLASTGGPGMYFLKMGLSTVISKLIEWVCTLIVVVM